jgi:hypothetical protein
MIDRWLKAVDKGELIGAVFLYLAKAFDPLSIFLTPVRNIF